MPREYFGGRQLTVDLERDGTFLDRALADAPLTGGDGVAPAPPEPLVLVDVRYPGVTFEPDEVAVESARAVFQRRHREHLTGARVAGVLSPVGGDQ